MANTPLILLLGIYLDPMAIAAFGFAVIAAILCIVLLTIVARRSANDAWDAARRRPKLLRKAAIQLPSLPTISVKNSTSRPVSYRKSVGSFNLLESIAKEPICDEPSTGPGSSVASTFGLLEDWSVMEVDEDASKTMQDSMTDKRSRSRGTLSSLFSFGDKRARTPVNAMPTRECWWKTEESGDGRSTPKL